VERVTKLGSQESYWMAPSIQKGNQGAIGTCAPPCRAATGGAASFLVMLWILDELHSSIRDGNYWLALAWPHK